MAEEKKKRAFMSLRIKLIGALTILFGVMVVAAYFGFTELARNLALQRVEEDLVGTLEAAAKGVNAEDFSSLAQDARALVRELATADTGFAVPDFSGSTIAVVAVSSDGGTWQYSMDEGNSWQDFPAVSEASAFQLTSNTENKVRLVSDEYDGAASISYQKIETEGPENGATVDVSPADESAEGPSVTSLARMGYNVAGERLIDDPRYQRLLDWLDEVNRLESRAWPFIYVPEDQTNSFVAIADLWSRYDEEKAYSFLYYTISTKGIITQGFDKLTYHPDNKNGGYSDDWGSWVTAYAPIVDADGNSIGAMGIDFRGEYVAEAISSIQRQVLIFFVVGYLAFLIFIFVVAILFTRPISVLASAAKKIGEGDYEQDIQEMSIGPFRDEVTTLAGVFEIMISKVYQREQTLRRRVEELQIIVDEQKKAEQVSEIVESEFFQDLQAKAREMRARGRKDEEKKPKSKEKAGTRPKR
jgi:HAMP domain-containing protein